MLAVNPAASLHKPQKRVRPDTPLERTAVAVREANKHVYTELVYQRSGKQSRPTKLEGWLSRHERLWRRWLRIYGKRFDQDDVVRRDIRYWEAHISGIDIGPRPWVVSMDQMNRLLWWFGLHRINRFEVCQQMRLQRSIERRHLMAMRKKQQYAR